MISSSQRRLRIKFVAKGPAQPRTEVWLRQFPSRSGSWGRCDFVFDPEERHYDWFVVYDDLPVTGNERHSIRRESLACHPRNTLLVTAEPASVKYYGDDFLHQFGHVLTSQEPWVIRHPSAVFSQSGLRWFYGVGKFSIRDFDTIAHTKELRKTAIFSTVCSDKRQPHTLHRARYQFVQTLRNRLPERGVPMDVFGHGVRTIDDKAEAIDPYRYHLAIENHLAPHHWTEKLADPFLGLSMPVYCGCPNITDYFPHESLIVIDIRRPCEAADIITRAVRDNFYEQHLSALREARRRVLFEYNLFAVVSRLVEERHEIPAVSCLPTSIHPSHILSRHALRRGHPLHIARFVIRKLRIRHILRRQLRHGSFARCD